MLKYNQQKNIIQKIMTKRVQTFRYISMILIITLTNGCSLSASDANKQTQTYKLDKNMTFQDPAFEMMQSINSISERADAKTKLVTTFMKDYFNKIYQVEVEIAREMQKPEQNNQLMDELLEQQREIFKEFWLLDDQQRKKLYYPNSWSGDPHHDWSKMSNIKIFETGDDIKPQFLFLYDYEEYTDNKYPYSFSMIYKDGRLFITDNYFEL